MATVRIQLLIAAVIGCLAGTAAAEDAVKTRVITEGEGVMLTSKLAPETQEVVATQSFQVKLPLANSRYFVSIKTGKDDPSPVEFHIADAEGTSLQKLVPPDTWSMLEEVEAVSFRDMNADGIRDITVIVSWMTGAGPTGAQAFNAPTIFTCDPATGRYTVDTKLLEGAPYESTATLSGIVKYLSK